MWNVLQTVFGQMMIVLCMLLVGYFFNRRQWVSQEAEAVLSKLVTKLFLPALTFNTFLTRCTVENLREDWTLLLYGGVICLVSIAVSYPLSGWMARDDRYLAGVMRYAISFPNTGGVAYPLMLSMYGTMGLFRFNLFSLINLVFCYSWGIAQFSPETEQTTPLQKLKKVFNPNFVAILLGGALGLTGVAAALPGAFYEGLERLGSCYTPVALLLAGYVIADYPLREAFGDKKVYLMTALRLVLLPLSGLLVLKLLGVSDTVMLMACMTLVCPCGMNVVVFPASYGQSSRFGASLVLSSSVLSVITVPLLFALFCG